MRNGRNAAIRQLAKDQRQKDGEIEFDDRARISEGIENGAYVQAWVWVEFAGTPLDKEEDRWIVFANGKLCACGHFGSAHQHNPAIGADRCTEKSGGKPCTCNHYTGYRIIA